MQVIDLTQLICADMPVYPENEQPQFVQLSRVEEDGCSVAQVTLNYHVGTHIDAPQHMVAGGASIDEQPIERFCGRGVVLDCTGLAGEIGLAALTPHEALIRQADYVLLHTGWSRFWGAPAYYGSFPVLDEAAARYLADFSLKGVGVDALSVDALDSAAFPIHHLLLEQGLVIVENLTGLEHLPASGFTFCCLPLKIKSADGSPVRAVALV